ncbi:MAG: hypothetical protein KIT45_09145 [Fimbriimonadia bacterium]|nr:hypothetical protein [Fimbriimonadia bacterium]
MLTPYDFQENISQRAQYIEQRLREGSPVIGISFTDGLLLFSLKRRGRKVYEIYDQLMFSAIGNQSDIETMRLAAIDFTHKEGYARSPDDVTIQRVVGSALSPALKKGFGDAMTTPFVMRSIFAELGPQPERDLFYVLNYDGEFFQQERFAVVGGSYQAEDSAIKSLEDAYGKKVPTFEKSLPLAIIAWGIAREAAVGEGLAGVSEERARQRVREEVESASLEVGVLERNTTKESRFRLVPHETLEKYLQHL